MHGSHNRSSKEPPSWLIENVLSEIPYVGDFINSNNLPEALHKVGKSTAMLICGTVGMHVMSYNGMGQTIKMTIMTINMAIGMAVGSIGYNIISYLLNKIAHYYYSSAKRRFPLFEPGIEKNLHPKEAGKNKANDISNLFNTLKQNNHS